MGNREELLEGAKTCLLEKGYDRTTVRDIASAAGVSMAAIGYHYGSREALLQQALFTSLHDWDAGLKESLSGLNVPQGKGRFEAVWELLIENFRSQRTLWLASFELFLQAQRSPDLLEQYAKGQPGAFSAMAALATGESEETVAESVSRTAGSIQLALVSGIVMQWLSNPDTAPGPREIAAGLRALVETIDD
ncbi:TetR/AcrR family transcriptional regulator [Glycomyces buryatensis]|uniref:TetR/AcrR family transcriptional regulator n=1 Tax=Glycomyces buryatensis TaxID=2570927 RepID=A0A4S8QIH7_9ACTN|nr:TetR/AcrR family transcriptional regulator [Glycomyces buryatensis]THV41189.1 TetR/AcrR family transcriptional regulator [Glycomyces buryatensis]